MAVSRIFKGELLVRDEAREKGEEGTASKGRPADEKQSAGNLASFRRQNACLLRACRETSSSRKVFTRTKIV